MKLALLINPAARGGRQSAAAADAANRLRAHGIETSLISGGSAAESSALLQIALRAGADAVAVAGGDGTVHLALAEIAGTGIPLGIIPVGTGNDIAAALGLRELDVRGAADVIAAGRTRTVDLARITRDDGTFELMASVLASGFDSRVNDRANAMRWPRGSSRYTVALLIEFLTLHAAPFTLQMQLPDGSRRDVTDDLVIAAVGNGPSYGGGIPICPDADIADGLLDVTIVRPAGRLRLLRLLPRVYRGTHTTIPEVSTFRVRSVRLESEAVTGYADGDPIGLLPLTVEAVPGALTVFAPR
ncbi:diacylglycerol kinase [Microbacterium kribbense]|uniref:Diacylglycerol kinase n=1 Tax=Microbacterium kribbense TaxID=433645 RepID=A0ABP7GJA2_9MICO